MISRKTTQRAALREAFRRAGRPLSPQEVFEAAKVKSPRLGIATVYRTLKTLVEEGWLKPVEVPGEPPRYELAHLDHHHHFRCRQCRRLFDLKGCPGNLSSLLPEGFVLESHNILLEGLCEDCSPPRTQHK